MSRVILFSILRLFFFAFFAMLLLSSCEKTLNVKTSDMEPKIVLNGIIQPDSFIEIRASKSFSYFENNAKAAYLANAKLKLYVNGVFREEMRIVSENNENLKGHATLFRSTFRAGIGDKIRIEASAPNMKQGWAETQVPQTILIGKVDTTTFLTQEKLIKTDYYSSPYEGAPEIKQESFYRNLRMQIGLKTEKKKEEQFFQIQLKSIYCEKDFQYASLPIYTKDEPAFANNPQNSIFDMLFEKNHSFNGSQIFTDKLFKNNAHTLNIATTNYYTVDSKYKKDKNGYPYTVKDVNVLNSPIDIRITTLSPELYQYLKSRESRLYDDQEAVGMISEPSVTFSNVVNGIGIVGAISSTQKRIELRPFPGGKNVVPKQ